MPMHRFICSLFDRRHLTLWRRQFVAAVLAAALLLQSATAIAPGPAWWGAQEVLDGYAYPDDFAAANVGQLKDFAQKAAAAMNAPVNEGGLAGGAGTPINALVDSWDDEPPPGVVRNDFQALNLGQLKNVAQRFYDRLSLPYPWAGGSALRDDYRWVNVGQLKNVFSFALAFRTGGTLVEIPPATLAAALAAWGSLTLAPEHSTADDFDGDGIPNLQEFLMGNPLFDPLDIDGDRIPDLIEDLYPGILSKLRFADAVEDYDEDGVMNFEEVLLDLDLTAATTTGRSDGLTDAEVLAWGLCIADATLEPSTDAAAAAWQQIDVTWVDNHFGDPSWLDQTDANSDSEPDGLTAFRSGYGWEIFYIADNIANPPAPYDIDGDEIPDADRDYDGMPDLWEYRYAFNLRDSQDSYDDPDSDGMVNSYEFSQHTNPRLNDSDGDGFNDGNELSYGSNPNLPGSQPSITLSKVNGNGQSMSTGSQSRPLVVQVTQLGLPLSGAQITFSVATGTGTLKSGDAAGTIGSEVTVTTGSAGTATVTYLADITAGAASVTATLTSPVAQTTFALTVQVPPGTGGSVGPAGPWAEVPPSSGGSGTAPPAPPRPEPELLFHTSWLSVGGFGGWQNYSSGVSGRIGWVVPLRLESDPPNTPLGWTDSGLQWDVMNTSYGTGGDNVWSHFGQAKSAADAALTRSMPPIKNYFQPLPNAVPTSLGVDNWWAFYYPGPFSYCRDGKKEIWYDYLGEETEDPFAIEWISNERWGGIQGERVQYRLHNNKPVPYEVRRTFVKVSHTAPISGFDERVWYGTPEEQEDIPGHAVTSEVVEFVIPANKSDSANGLKTPGGILDVTAPIVEDTFTWVQLWPIELHIKNDPVCGDMIPSSDPKSAVNHFVTPKKTTEIPADHVAVEAWGITETDMLAGRLEWHVSPKDAGQKDPSDPTRFLVKRDKARHAIVGLGNKGGDVHTDSLKQHVWVVWSERVPPAGTWAGGSFKDIDWTTFILGQVPMPPIPVGKRWICQHEWSFKFKIEPEEIWHPLVVERPDLKGNKQTPPPGELPSSGTSKPYPPNPAIPDSDEAFYKWDVSRQVEMTIDNPAGITTDEFVNTIRRYSTSSSPPPTFYDPQPGANTIVFPFPTNPAEGNDDIPIIDEDANPYHVKTGMGILDHAEGELTSVDSPQFPVFNDWGKAGRTYGMKTIFREFTRLELWDGERPETEGPRWFRISDYVNWHHNLKATYNATDKRWENNGSSSNTGH